MRSRQQPRPSFLALSGLAAERPALAKTHRIRGHYFCGSQWYRPVGTTPLLRRYSIQPRRLQRPFHALMTFGRGDLGQLGLGAAMESVSEPTILQEAPLRKRFIHASASWSQNMVITEEQEVYSWGTAGLALGIPHRGANAFYPTYVESCRALKLKTICCGRHHTVALNTRGEVFAWGDNDLGQVGIVEGQKEGVPQPVRLEKLRKSGAITEIACGLDHNLALTDDQRVWGWGFGVDGQVGNGSPDIVQEPVLLDTRAVRVKKVRCGTDFSAMLGEDGYIYTFGSSEVGQLGHGKKGVLMHPTAIESIPDAVEDVACGGAHSLALTVKGEVYSWGYGGYGRLGHGDNHDSSIPEKIDFFDDKDVKSIHAGGGQSFVCTADGTVYAFGLAAEGRLGLPNAPEGVATPTPIPGLAGHKVVHLAPGIDHTLVVVEAPPE